MNLRERGSRYSSPVMFSAGIAGMMFVVASVQANFRPDLEVLLGGALVVTFLLYARTGFALSKARREIEMSRALLEKFTGGAKSIKTPEIRLDELEDISDADSKILNDVRGAIESQRVDLYLQPIVSLPQRKQRYFEAFSRLRCEDDSLLTPAVYIDAAERANKIGVIDNMILLRVVQSLRQLGPAAQHYKVFCNVSPATLYDKEFFDRFTDYLDVNQDLASRLVFEFTWPAVEMMNSVVEKSIEAIAERGFVFSLDHIRRFDLNWDTLRSKNFRYVKAPSAMLLAECQRGDIGRSRVKTFREKLIDNGIDLIVEKVELESHVPEIVALGIDFGQGDLFGAPRPASVYLPPAMAKAS